MSGARGERARLAARVAGLRLSSRRRVGARHARYVDDPVGFVREVLGEELWSKQREIAEAVRDHRHVAVRSAHDTGKSFVASRLAAWWLSVHEPGDAFVVTTAPTFAQVRAILWREINRAHRKGGLVGRVNQTEWWIDKEIVAYGRKPADYDEDSFQGIHARYVLVILDEACGIPGSLWTAAETIATNDGCRVLAIGNPDTPLSQFKRACDPGSGWQVIHVDGLRSPNFTGESVPAALGELLLSPTWVEERRADWGEDSALFQSKVRGEFPAVPQGQVYRELGPHLQWYGELPRFSRVVGGLDFGGANDEAHMTAGVIAGVVASVGSTDERGVTWQRASEATRASEDAGTLVTLEAIAPDMVLPRYDRDGTSRRSLKYAFVIEELPASDFAPGTELARAAAEAAGVPEGELDRYGLYADRDGRIQGGVTRGGEPQSASNSGKRRWTLARFVTRDEVYYFVTTNPASGAGQTIWHERHGAGKVPLVPVPGMYTDSAQPGGEFSSLMESVFALTPILNQIETLLSNVATWNALGRFVVEDVDGRLVAGDDGEPLIMSTDDMVGLDPQDVSIVRGHIRQLTIDASLLLQLLDFYSRRLDQSKPAPVTEGQAGASAAAWQVRLLLEASGELLGQAVNNHAEAVKEVMLLWVRWLRMLDEPVFVFGVPGKRKDRETVRGLIEFDPSDLVESLHVAQSSQSAQQRVVLQQAGIELLRAGRIDDRQYYEEFALADDPEEAELRAIVQQVKQAVLFGDVSAAPPGSVLGDVVQAVRGRITMQMLDQSPNFAMASAEQMAEQSSMAAQQAQAAAMQQMQGGQGQAGGPPSGSGPQIPNPQGGNFAAAMGVREPGMGMGIDLPGEPVAPGVATP